MSMADNDSGTNPTRTIRFGQINLHKSKAAAAELNSRQYYDIVFVTEPYVPSGKVNLETGGGTVVSATSGSPRACLRSYLPTWKVDKYTDRDMATAMIRSAEGDLCVSSVYLDINLKVCKDLFLELVDECKMRSVPLIVGMDSNSWSPMWGSEVYNPRGEELEASILGRELVLLNQGSNSTFETCRSSSAIDLTIANVHALDRWNFDDWRVEQIESFSDHK